MDIDASFYGLYCALVCRSRQFFVLVLQKKSRKVRTTSYFSEIYGHLKRTTYFSTTLHLMNSQVSKVKCLLEQLSSGKVIVPVCRPVQI